MVRESRRPASLSSAGARAAGVASPVSPVLLDRQTYSAGGNAQPCPSSIFGLQTMSAEEEQVMQMGPGDPVVMATVTPGCTPLPSPTYRGHASPREELEAAKEKRKGFAAASPHRSPALLPPVPLAAMTPLAQTTARPESGQRRNPLVRALNSAGRSTNRIAEKAFTAALRAEMAQHERLSMWSDGELEAAVLAGDAKLTQQCLLRGMDPNGANADRRPFLHLACEAGHHEVVRILVRLGADVHAPDPTRDGQTPLHAATVRNHHDIVLHLMLSGADVNAVDAKGRTPLHLAARKQCRILCEYLLAKGADSRRVDHDGFTPAECFSISDHVGVVDKNIAGAIISEHYLRQLFDATSEGKGHVTVEEFQACWEQLDTLGVPLRLPYILRRTGRISYPQFCVEMLKIAQW